MVRALISGELSSMTMPSDDAMTETVTVRRVEIFTGASQRRTWSEEAKRQIVAESYSGLETACAVARRYGLSPTQLFTWRRAFRTPAAQSAEAERADPERRAATAARRRANRGRLPEHLPRIESLVDIEDKTCPCCAGALHMIGEDRAERLDIVPAQLRVLVVRRPKYACRACEDVVVQAPANNDDEFTRDIVAKYKASERGVAAVMEPRQIIMNYES